MTQMYIQLIEEVKSERTSGAIEGWNLILKQNDHKQQCLLEFLRQTDGTKLHEGIGNPESMFVTVCQEKQGVVRGAKGSGNIVAEIDCSPVVDRKGNVFECTVRRRACDILCIPSGYSEHCKACQAFRSTLRGMVLRQSHKSSSSTSASSHTRYCDLSPAEKDSWMRSLHAAVKYSNQRVK